MYSIKYLFYYRNTQKHSMLLYYLNSVAIENKSLLFVNNTLVNTLQKKERKKKYVFLKFLYVEDSVI
jgi:hypothetical protein